jgi:hypothetical protein
LYYPDELYSELERKFLHENKIIPATKLDFLGFVNRHPLSIFA